MSDEPRPGTARRRPPAGTPTASGADGPGPASGAGGARTASNAGGTSTVGGAGGTPPVGGAGGGGLPTVPAGPELARAVLDAAKARRESSAASRRRGTVGGGDGTQRRLRGYSGPGPDPRDPQPLGAVLNRLVKARGWQQPAAEAMVFGAWERVVGADVAQHSRPVKLEDGELTVEARSTAWATQLRLLAGSLLQQIGREVGHNVVRKLHIHGPAAPSWSRGPRRVRGRGPRDTYG